MKKKRAVYFTVSTGRVVNGGTVEVRVASSWNPGKSRNKFKI